jgi:hypothetical protein
MTYGPEHRVPSVDRFRGDGRGCAPADRIGVKLLTERQCAKPHVAILDPPNQRTSWRPWRFPAARAVGGPGDSALVLG